LSPTKIETNKRGKKYRLGGPGDKRGPFANCMGGGKKRWKDGKKKRMQSTGLWQGESGGKTLNDQIARGSNGCKAAGKKEENQYTQMGTSLGFEKKWKG